MITLKSLESIFDYWTVSFIDQIENHFTVDQHDNFEHDFHTIHGGKLSNESLMNYDQVQFYHLVAG